MGCSTQGEDKANVSSETVQHVASNDTAGAVANKDGFEQDARWGFRRGDDHRGWGFRRGHDRDDWGFGRGHDRDDWGRRWGWRRDRDDRREWWRFW
jgi:hypothetical protein